MVEVPAVVVYVATAALVVVCVFLGVFLYYLIKIAQVALYMAQIIAEERKRVHDTLERTARTLRLVFSFFGND